ncbi:hypothetical protein PHMEG_00020012 [Phytophthora megakarya]|uniref:Uncharacterized protein n=1 Tax=Phytophthora megakarya TaxID=4795 RepID=A0A225VR33_9STRA|nr:hypothetical protein PHMEG_00020012 [Phytophthora megakarya]
MLEAGKKEKKTLAKQLHDALYSVDGELRPPLEMSNRFESVLHSVKRSDITCSEAEWQGSLASYLRQINRGDLYVPSITFSEGGGGDVRIVSTSQLEGSPSALKKGLARSE